MMWGMMLLAKFFPFVFCRQPSWRRHASAERLIFTPLILSLTSASSLGTKWQERR